jgi:DNA-directed RNA polymerase specialized sigma24 family protein
MPGRNNFKKELPKYYDDLYNFSLYLTGNYKTADKLTLRVIKEALDFSEFYVSPDLSGWLLRIGLNLYRKHYSLNSPDIQKTEEAFSKLSPYVDNKLLRELFTGLSEKDLLKILSKLPPEIRLPLVLKDILDMNYKTISEFIDIPEGTIALRLASARKIIYTELMMEFNKDG